MRSLWSHEVLVESLADCGLADDILIPHNSPFTPTNQKKVKGP